MNNQTIYIIIAIFLIIFFISILTISKRKDKLEHLTTQSDEAIQNIASLYNKDKLTVSRLALGDKWVLTGTGRDTAGTDDEWLRVLDKNGAYYGGIAASKFFDLGMGTTIQNYIDTKIATTNANVAAQVATINANVAAINANVAAHSAKLGWLSDNMANYVRYNDDTIRLMYTSNGTPWTGSPLYVKKGFP